MSRLGLKNTNVSLNFFWVGYKIKCPVVIGAAQFEQVWPKKTSLKKMWGRLHKIEWASKNYIGSDVQFEQVRSATNESLKN